VKEPDSDWPYINGTVWQTRMYSRCVLMFLGDGFCLASVGRSYAGWPAHNLNNYHEVDNKWLYKHEELPARMKDWRCLGYWSGHEEKTVREFLSPEAFAELGERECTREGTPWTDIARHSSNSAGSQ
jgi:hypothetical protein